MRKSIIGIIISVVIVLILGVVFFSLDKKPLKNLKASDVASIKVAALPPNEIKYVDRREDIETIISMLRKIVIYDEVKQDDYVGQVIIYTLVLKNGSEREFLISNPIVTIDGFFYKAKFSPADDLGNLYNKLNYAAIKK